MFLWQRCYTRRYSATWRPSSSRCTRPPANTTRQARGMMLYRYAMLSHRWDTMSSWRHSGALGKEPENTTRCCRTYASSWSYMTQNFGNTDNLGRILLIVYCGLDGIQRTEKTWYWAERKYNRRVYEATWRAAGAKRACHGLRRLDLEHSAPHLPCQLPHELGLEHSAPHLPR